jgi:hypothetical protein
MQKLNCGWRGICSYKYPLPWRSREDLAINHDLLFSYAYNAEPVCLSGSRAEAEGEGGEGFYITQSGRSPDLLVILGGGRGRESGEFAAGGPDARQMASLGSTG